MRRRECQHLHRSHHDRRESDGVDICSQLSSFLPFEKAIQHERPRFLHATRQPYRAVFGKRQGELFGHEEPQDSDLIADRRASSLDEAFESLARWKSRWWVGCLEDPLDLRDDAFEQCVERWKMAKDRPAAQAHVLRETSRGEGRDASGRNDIQRGIDELLLAVFRATTKLSHEEESKRLLLIVQGRYSDFVGCAWGQTDPTLVSHLCFHGEANLAGR